MISTNFYPTDSQVYPDIEVTGHLQDISGFAENMADAYLMGYIPADKMPAAFMPVYLSGGVGTMSAIYHPKNTGWGYGWLDLNEEYRYATSFTRVNDEIIARPAERNKYRLFNSIKMARANTGMTISILFTFAFIDDAVYDGDGGTVDFVQGGLQAGGWGQATETITYTFDQFADIIENDLPLFSRTKIGNTGVIEGKSFTFEPKPSEFGESTDPSVDHKWIKDSGQGAQAIVFIDGYSIQTSMAYANGNGGTNSYYLRPFTYPDIDAVDNLPSTKAMLFPAELSNMSQRLNWAYNTDTRIFELTPGNTQTYTIADYNINPGGFNFGTINDNEIDFTSPTQGSRTLLIKKSLWMNATGYGTRKSGNIQNIYTPLDVYRHALLYHKHTTDGTQTSYGSGNTWTTFFYPDNAPSERILTGSFSSIAGNLRPWQLPDVDISSNEFTPEDVPPDPGPEPAEENDSGDISYNTNIPAGISSFITQYIMTAGQIKTFGQSLWSGLSRPTMIQNFFLFNNVDPDTTTYELSMSNIINYIISIKYFPFDLSTISAHQASGNGIKIGRGTELIGSGVAPFIPNSQIVILDGGSCTIPTNYANFLDHEPYSSISVYVPYCGVVNLSPSMVVGYTLHLQYCVDLVTGGCYAVISKSGQGATFPIATINGTVGFEIMLTGNNAQTVQANANNSFGNYIGSQSINAASSVISAGMSGSPETLVGGLLSGVKEGMNFANNIPQMMGTSPLTAGSNSSLCSLMQPQTAYVQFRHHVDGSKDFVRSVGGIVNKYMLLSGVNGMGYVKIVNPRLEGLKCTDAEKERIKQQLASGIFT